MTRRRLIVGPLTGLLIALVVAALAAGGTSAKPTVKKFTATLNVGQETGVVKSTKRGASGSFSATLSGTTLTYKLTFTHLSGPATAAHIHGPADPGANAGIVVPFTGNITSPIKGSATLTDAQIAQLEAGKWYVNIHTEANKPGEIRGQLVRAS